MIRAAGLLTLLVLALAACGKGDSPTGQEPQEDYAESSGNFDRDQVQPFLNRLSSALEAGFGPDEVSQVMSTLAGLKVDEETELEFTVTYHGEAVPLNLTVVLDDADSPDLYFYTSPGLVERLDELMDQFAQELEQT